MDKSILNILDVSDSIVMLIYTSSGAYFFDFNTSENVGYVPHEYFNPFRCSILKISDHELLIGAEYSIFLIDYKKFQKIKEFENDASYALYKLSNQYLLTSYGEGLLQIFQMSRDNDGQLELNYLNRSQIIDDIVAGIAKLPDGRYADVINKVKQNKLENGQTEQEDEIRIKHKSDLENIKRYLNRQEKKSDEIEKKVKRKTLKQKFIDLSKKVLKKIGDYFIEEEIFEEENAILEQETYNKGINGRAK